MAIQNRTMLVQLTIHQWTGVRHDKTVSAEVERAHAATNAGRYNKHLIDKTHLAPISTAANALRAFHYSRTLAWADGGQRILPSALFMQYRDDLAKHSRAFDQEVSHFIGKYPDLVQAARQSLGTMYNPKDYPDATDLRKSFGIDLNIMPVPDAADFRVDVDDETRAEIQASITASIAERQAGTVKECWNRLRDVLERIVEQCSKEKPIIRDSLMENAMSLADVLQGLNITGDPQLARAEVELKALCCSPVALRMSAQRRSETAAKASEILSWMPS